ncbi:hypothetical protein KIPB_006763 [Kipferlia bialata]|uniref:Uncharacterized protein n=1 Tax=Kipferlia bialata TaxID=797122 RepID=A0A9K3GK18_9EUKA|nr:hypothetical protein KIPB_006763 [Kipferlia bialata]|eukprot:g6763.t1
MSVPSLSTDEAVVLCSYFLSVIGDKGVRGPDRFSKPVVFGVLRALDNTFPGELEPFNSQTPKCELVPILQSWFGSASDDLERVMKLAELAISARCRRPKPPSQQRVAKLSRSGCRYMRQFRSTSCGHPSTRTSTSGDHTSTSTSGV